jgi:glycosyltransferase involved in cell wall biosynthesis
MSGRRLRVLAVSTLGAGSNEESRVRALLRDHDAEVFAFDRGRKLASFRGLASRICASPRPELVVVEGTGLAGGLAALWGRLFCRVPYVISSGDAVGPYVGMRAPGLGPVFGLYERVLCRLSAGYIGWTPYLAGRALTFGAPRAMTAAGWAPFAASGADARARVRGRLGIPENALVVGIVGNLSWNGRVGYCYGRELVAALARTKRADLHAVIVGRGSGHDRLAAAASARLGRTIHLAGYVEQSEVPDFLSAFDVASLPQSVDRVGGFRYTTKLSEYLAAGLPVVTGRIPMAYDLGGDWLVRLPGRAPWDPRYVEALASWLDGLGAEELARRRAAVPRREPLFDRDLQASRVGAFVSELGE